MLTLTLEKVEMYNEEFEVFVELSEEKVDLEHSLVSVSKWEAIWEKPFLTNDERSTEEMYSYIKCMIVSPRDVSNFEERLTSEHLSQVSDYIERRMTATWFSESSRPPSREIITSEVLYYQMTMLNIPERFETWHLNRLLTLIRVYQEKQAPEKKRLSQKEIMDRNRLLNAQRKAQYNTRG